MSNFLKNSCLQDLKAIGGSRLYSSSLSRFLYGFSTECQVIRQRVDSISLARTNARDRLSKLPTTVCGVADLLAKVSLKNPGRIPSGNSGRYCNENSLVRSLDGSTRFVLNSFLVSSNSTRLSVLAEIECLDSLLEDTFKNAYRNSSSRDCDVTRAYSSSETAKQLEDPSMPVQHTLPTNDADWDERLEDPSDDASMTCPAKIPEIKELLDESSEITWAAALSHHAAMTLTTGIAKIGKHSSYKSIIRLGIWLRNHGNSIILWLGLGALLVFLRCICILRQSLGLLSPRWSILHAQCPLDSGPAESDDEGQSSSQPGATSTQTSTSSYPQIIPRKKVSPGRGRRAVSSINSPF